MLTVTKKPQEVIRKVESLEKIDWDAAQDPKLIKEAIDFALANGYASMAITLAAKGQQLFPEDADLQKIAKVLAPPKVIRTDVPPAVGLDETMQWLKENGSYYRGQWVAIKEGELIGHAQTRDDLSNLISDVEEQAAVVITKIPSFRIEF